MVLTQFTMPSCGILFRCGALRDNTLPVAQDPPGDLQCWHSLLCHLVDPLLPHRPVRSLEHCDQTTTLLPAQGSSGDINGWPTVFTQLTMPSWAPSVFTWTLMWDQHCDQASTLLPAQGSPGDINGRLMVFTQFTMPSCAPLCYHPLLPLRGNTVARQPPFHLPKALLVILMADLRCWHSLQWRLVHRLCFPGAICKQGQVVATHCGYSKLYGHKHYMSTHGIIKP